MHKYLTSVFFAFLMIFCTFSDHAAGEEIEHYYPDVNVFCEQGIRIADYHLHIYNHMNPTNYSHGYWDGQKDAYNAVKDLINEY